MAPQVQTLKIDGHDVAGRSDQTILEVAQENDIAIPTLCHLEGLSEVGACRLCVVEIAGTARLSAACVTPIREGLEVTTNSPRLMNYRRMILEMLFAERNHVCSVCVSNGRCELQGLAQVLGMDHIRAPGLFPDLHVDASHHRFVIDHNRCILCSRCVRVCDEIEGAHTWDLTGRGVETYVITDLNQPWIDSESCTNCGKCVHVCPTGALFEKGSAVAEMRKQRHFLSYLTAMRELRS